MKSKPFYPKAILSLLALFAITSAVGLWFLHKTYNALLPDVTVLKDHYPEVIGRDSNSLLVALRKQKPKNWTSYNSISRRAINAVLTSEDGNFFSHPGYDADAIRAAMEYNNRPNTKIKRGASTITQQVVKNIFLTHDRTITRKIRELLLAVELEQTLSKRQILELYFNIVEWGPGIYGIKEAARRYFGKSPSELTARDGAILAYLLPNPRKYRLNIREGEVLSSYGNRRVHSILNKMYKSGRISDEEFFSGVLKESLPDSVDSL